MPEKVLALHVGTHKTGTSAIQNFLFENQERLVGACYLNRGTANSSLWMLQAFKNDFSDVVTVNRSEVEKKGSANLRSRARKQLESACRCSDAPVSILSAESISLFEADELQDLSDFLKPLFDIVEVHQYVRPVKSKLESAFQEKLKRRFVSLEEKVTINYWRRTQILDQAFGRENVHVHKYDPSEFPGNDVVQHFLASLGINRGDLRPSEVANTGLSFPAVQLLYVYRMHHQSFQPQDRRILELLSTLKGKPLRFHNELFSRIATVDPKWVSRFEERVGFPLTNRTAETDEPGLRSEHELTSIPESSIDWLMQHVTQSAGDARMAPEDLKSVAECIGALADSAA